MLGHVLDRVDVLVIGGGMANTFLNAKGVNVGKSLCERDLADTAREIMAKAEAKNVRIVLPEDGVVATKLEEGAATRTVPVDAGGRRRHDPRRRPQDRRGRRPRAGALQDAALERPLGRLRGPPVRQGTNAAARKAAELTRAGKLQSVAGGGDTVAALAHAGVLEDFTYVSTAGGAFLEWLEGKELPGVAALRPR